MVVLFVRSLLLTGTGPPRVAGRWLWLVRVGRAVLIAPLVFLVSCKTQPARPLGVAQVSNLRFAAAREAMVSDQLRARGIKDQAVLAAMSRVPREEFVPPDQRPFAYEDRPLPIGQGQTISQPYIVALMTELLGIKQPGSAGFQPARDKVLEIGTGSGYQAAVLAELTPHVYTIEILPELANRARATLKRLGYRSVEVKAGDGYQGWAEHAPFDAIIVTCAPEKVPQPLADQLREGGRMVIPVGPQWEHQTLYLLQKRHGKLESTAVIPVAFVPMVR